MLEADRAVYTFFDLTIAEPALPATGTDSKLVIALASSAGSLLVAGLVLMIVRTRRRTSSLG
jgi:LPXTG-motif cell wall-anchored protein